ncbi:hypothetical protein BWR19_03150 [Halomonas sp. 1513]|nr:hypothetical protein BWR19_03150 [Halomonas sp. 1513]
MLDQGYAERTPDTARQSPLDVLLIGPDSPDMLGLQEILQAGGSDYRIRRVATLQQALAVLREQPVAMLLLDLTLAQCPWRAALEQLSAAAPGTLCIGLTDDSEPTPCQARRHGAHDVFSLAQLEPRSLLQRLETDLYLIQPRSDDQASYSALQTMSDAMPIGTLITDRYGHCLHSNAAYQRICGLTAGGQDGRHWAAALHPDDRQRVVATCQEAPGPHGQCHLEARILRPDDSVIWVCINVAQLPGGHGHVHTMEDITARKDNENKLRATQLALHIEKERAQVTLNSIGDAVISTDTACRVTYLNRVAQEMTGWSQEDAMGRPISEVFRIVDETSRQLANDPARRAIEENRIVGLAMGTILIGRDGSELAIEDSAAPIRDRDGQVTGAVIVFHHVSQSLTIANRMSHLAQHDALTDLPNRVLLHERLTRAIGLAQRHSQLVALIFIDLDDFKAINDRLGHAAGDTLLKSIASRLKSSVRDTDTVCRLGGDEFVILLTEVKSIDAARKGAEAIVNALLLPHRVSHQAVSITASLGISLYPNSGATPDELMQRADTAMYHIKRQGRNSYQFFSGDMLPDHPQRFSTVCNAGPEP